MGWLRSRKSESFSVDEILDLPDKEIEKLIKKGKAPARSAKELRKMAKDDRRRLEGEKGFQAFRAVVKESRDQKERAFNQYEKDLRAGKHHARERMKATDEKAYQRLLHEEAKRQGLI